MLRPLLLLTLGAVLGAFVLGCGGTPDPDEFVGIVALCNDGTLVTSEDETGCDSHGGADETYIGDPPSTRP